MSTNGQQNGQGDYSDRPKKIYLGNAQAKKRKSGDDFLAGSICLDDVENVPEEHIQKGTNGKRYIRIIVNPYREGANQYGNTHSISIDTFKPNKDGQGSGGTSGGSSKNWEYGSGNNTDFI